MKKILSVIITAVLALSLTACGKTAESAVTTVPTTEEARDWDALGGQGWDAYNAGDYKTAVEFFKEAAESGETKYIASLGDAYAKSGDYQAALDCYRQLIDQGDTQGMLYTASLYSTYLQEYDTAIEWLEKGADAGNTACMRELGHMYEHGLGVEQDAEKADYWYKLAADEK